MKTNLFSQKNSGGGVRFKGAVIGAGGDSVYAIRRAKELGLTVVAVDGNPKACYEKSSTSYSCLIRGSDIRRLHGQSRIG